MLKCLDPHVNFSDSDNNSIINRIHCLNCPLIVGMFDDLPRLSWCSRIAFVVLVYAPANGFFVLLPIISPFLYTQLMIFMIL